MHILIIPSEHFVTKQNPLGGIFQLHQAKALSELGYKVGVLSVGYVTPRYLISKYIYKKEEKINDINIKRYYKQLYFPHRYMPFKILKNNYIKMADKLYIEYTKEFGIPDIIHAHNFLYAGLVAESLSKKYDIPYIITEHSTEFARNLVDTKYYDLLKNAAKKSIVVTAVSTPFAHLLSSILGTKVKVLPNIVDDLFFKDDFKKVDKKEFTFLNVALLDSKKNHILLLEAFAKLFRFENVVLKIVGDGVMETELKEKVKELNIEKRVLFLGRLTQEKVQQEMMNADCFVLSSDYETFGVVLIEALACGLPLVATKCGGPEDIVNDKNGILVNVGDEEQLFNAMKYILDNKNKFDRQELRDESQNNFGKNAFLQNINRFYKIGENNGK